jgi:uncharacterized protein GlcG (DUF336 family)
MHRLTLAQARALIDAAMAEAKARGMQPLTFGVFDPGANLIAMRRQDGAPPGGPAVVASKVNGALAVGISSRQLGELGDVYPAILGPIGSVFKGGVLPAAGGLAIRDGAGHIVGAVGVSGDTADNDEIAARAGIAALGLDAVG